MVRGPKRLKFALAAIALAVLASSALLLAVDIYLHRKYERTAGFNVWGYRGPSLGRKQAGEYRIAFLGGSTAFGYGGGWEDAIPALLDRRLRGRRSGAFDRFAVANLAYNNEAAYSFRYTLDDYLWLKYDLAVLYEGYNDVMGDSDRPNTSLFRHDSPVFRFTGYMPIFPMIFREKASAMIYGDVKALYAPGAKTAFRPGVATRTAAETLRIAADVSESLSHQVNRATGQRWRSIDDVGHTGCKPPWLQYCQSVLLAVEFAVAHHTQVLVVTQPYELVVGERHIEQQREMAAMLERRFGGDARVGYVNLGPEVDLADPALSYDHMHLTTAGNARIADRLVEPVREMAAQRGARARE
jgi:hypothetical protein